MPRELFEIKLFQHGTMTTPDDADIPKDAASWSINLRADASDGRLQGIQNDKIIVKPFDLGTQEFVECAASNLVTELVTSGFDMVVEDEVENNTTSPNCGIKLFSLPTSSVVITVTSDTNTTDWEETGIDVSTSTLTFTTSNYATVQNITFSAGNSYFVNYGYSPVVIRFVCASSDSNWDGLVFTYTLKHKAVYDTGYEVQFVDMILDEGTASNTGSFKVRPRSRPDSESGASVSANVDYQGWQWGDGSAGENSVSWTNTTSTSHSDYWYKWKTISFNAIDDTVWLGQGPITAFVQLTGHSDDSSFNAGQYSGGFFFSSQDQIDAYMGDAGEYSIGDQLESHMGVGVQQDQDNDPADDDGADPPGGGDTCFEGNTMVSTPEGDVNISDLEEGQEIYSWNNKKGKMVKNKVRQFLSHLNLEEGYPIYKVTFGDGDYILSTASHMFWNEDHARYLQIENFNEGDRLRTDVGFFKTVKSNELWKKDLSEVFNFHTENAPHNYFANGVLVHNGGGEDVVNNLVFFLRKIGLMGNLSPMMMIHNPGGGGGKRPKPDDPVATGTNSQGA